MEFNNILQINSGLRKKDFSAVDVVESFLEKIKRKDKEISSFLTITENLALDKAKEIDKKIKLGEEISLLSGIPFAIKDNILVKGIRNTCGSRILENYIAPYDATCIKKLKKEGIIILGKTNMDEFAMGASTENSSFFTTKNPADKSKVPGGSSGGSAAAVAAGMCHCALGSDTGGSIRQPASFCGVVGLKPTYGSVSRYGLVSLASSLDQIGPIVKNVEDAEIVFNAISGKDEKDSTSADKKSKERSRLKIGIPKDYFIEGIDPEVKKLVERSISKLGLEIEEISLPHTKYTIPTYYLINTSEASANLARYDGIKYGLSIQGKETDNLFEVYSKTREKGFGNEVKRRIMLGTYALSSGYYDAYYLKAQKVRSLISKDFEEAFKRVDVILSPVSPSTAFNIGEKKKDPLSMYLCDIFTSAVNLVGLPAISIPLKIDKGLPIGIQVIGRHFEENNIFKIGKLIEKNG